MYEYTELYYGTPCQVRFYDSAEDEMSGGIAYHDFIICGRTGDIKLIETIINDAQRAGIHWDDAVIELEWIDLSSSIL